MAEPDEYHKSATLKLYFKDVKDCSVDEVGAVKFGGDKSKANTHGTWVQQVQKDLIALCYLPEKDAKGVEMADGYFGRSSARAIGRFQRHAARLYRMDTAKAIQDVTAADAFTGKESGICDAATATEMRKWIDKKWVNPVGRFKIKALSGGVGGKLREDAATAWDGVVKAVTDKGGTLEGVYGDTLRALDYGKSTQKQGTSNFSFHYCGRAVDIRQALADPPDSKRRYYIMSDPSGGNQYWKILCKTTKQDGTQGFQVKKGEKKRWDFVDKKEYNIPEGYYLDLTLEIESGGKFQRINAQKGWETVTDKAEWWHFQYKVDIQPTFLDEVELIGTDEATLRKVKNQAGIVKWPDDAHMDHKPG